MFVVYINIIFLNSLSKKCIEQTLGNSFNFMKKERKKYKIDDDYDNIYACNNLLTCCPRTTNHPVHVMSFSYMIFF